MDNSNNNNIVAPRRHDLDNLRSFLTCLVIAHHTAIVYGGIGSWAFRSSCFGSTSDILQIFNAINQSFFMGLFFWISGHMSAQMLGRRPPAEFVRKKCLRLGIPTLLYTLLLLPLTWILAHPEWNVDVVAQRLLAYWKSIRGVRGLVWYTALLLVFDCVAAVIEVGLCSRRIVLEDEDSQGRHRRSTLVYKGLSTWGWVFVAAVSFFVRLGYPVGTVVEPLDVQPAYLPQYILAYSLGYLSVRQKEDRFTGPFDRVPDTSESVEAGSQLSKRRAPSLRFAFAISGLAFLACAIPELWARRSAKLDNSPEAVRGGWNLSALIYAVWNEFSFVLVGPALMAHFQRRRNQPATSWLWQPRYSYAVYLIHPPVSVSIEVLIDWLPCAGGTGFGASKMMWWRVVGPVFFTGIVGLVSSAASFALGRFLVTYIPGVRKVI